MIKNVLLELIDEQKIWTLFRDFSEKSKLEASGVAVKDDYCYVVFDNLMQIACVHKSLSNSENKLLGSKGKNSLFEDITFNEYNQRFYVIIEAVAKGKKVFKPVLNEYDIEFNLIENHCIDFTFDSENKGFEGIEHIRKENIDYLLALCEGNDCKGGKAGAKPGKGRIVLFERETDEWKLVKTINLPEALPFEDYSALSIQNNKIAVVSQECSALWVGELDTEKWEINNEGSVSYFPLNKKSKKAYCNIEGVAWLSDNEIVVVSDQGKRKKKKQADKKDQSIHIFKLII